MGWGGDKKIELFVALEMLVWTQSTLHMELQSVMNSRLSNADAWICMQTATAFD